MAPRKTTKKTAPPSVVRRATLTEEAIKFYLEADQGNAYRHYLGHYMAMAKDPFRAESGPRSHLGASVIGDICDRKIWYGFRWATEQKLDAQLIRLFNRGHLEEPRFLALLAMIGCQIFNIDLATGEQFTITGHGGHYAGSLDGVVGKCPDIPDEAVLLEFKTASSSAFAKVVEQGIQVNKPEYYAQVCQYMSAYNLNYTLFMMVNKDNDEIYTEIIARNDDKARNDYNKAKDIIFSDAPMQRCSNEPGFWKCGWCEHSGICHEPESHAPAMSCRTCAHVTPTEDGKWICENPEQQKDVMGSEIAFLLEYDDQRAGCSHYECYTGYVDQD